ncbi:aminoacyl-tRNA hydrolase [Microbacterium nanhaiense]|uniref:Aminoacyl-tRNA hydrolase n=1 Tax=Microbacterium nanhaiense TaxID=1301026 RepID=A0ABQ2MZ99_9MICO|nr:alternative ribosome rescue aminoacyl-tRNA hydrolase ArfB [Microbacterium nanhaiense]GGO60927.1 aminoacyl-tRNA hydrolase [Microbacterium nanhaiense]
MDDLLVPAGPGAPRGIRVPGAELVEQFSRSSGPGGQGVNTTDSRVQLSFDVSRSAAFSDSQRSRILARLESRLAGGVLTIAASEERSQRQNRQAARARLAEILRAAVMPEVQRRATKPTRGSQRRRLDGKKQRAQIKQSRRRPNAE